MVRRKAAAASRSAPPDSTIPDPAAPCRIQVRFEGHEPLYYRASRAVAQQFARSAGNAGAHVHIDDEPTDGLRPLPCEQLWAS